MDWMVFCVDSEEVGYEVVLVFDGDLKIFWCLKFFFEFYYLMIDLGCEYILIGFVYILLVDRSFSKLEGGQVEISFDGKYFMLGEIFWFGNLMNDLIQWMYYFKEFVKVWYLIFCVYQVIDGGWVVCIVEIDVMMEQF